MARTDETQFSLLAWSSDSAAAERLAVQVLLASGFTDADPSHPYGGPDGGRDAILIKDHQPWAMAVYFPRSNPSFTDVKAKFKSDLDSARAHSPHGFVFVTNQEVTLRQRTELKELASGLDVELFHMERVAAVLDQPAMSGVRNQFLGIERGPVALALLLEILGEARHFTDGSSTRTLLLDQDDDAIRQDAEESRSMPRSEREHLAQMAKLLHQPAPVDPPTAEEVQEMLATRRVWLEREWQRVEDYISGMAWPAARFIVTNDAPSFLHDIRLVIKFDGAYGVAKDFPGNFEHEKLLDPDYARPFDPLYGSIPQFDAGPPADYPVAWRNVDSVLEVRITLAELPPGEAFRWDGEDYEDVVLIARGDTPSVSVTWVAAARGHGTAFAGPNLELDVEGVSLREAINEVARRSRE